MGLIAECRLPFNGLPVSENGQLLVAVQYDGDVNVYGLTVDHILMNDTTDKQALESKNEEARLSDNGGLDISDSESETPSCSLDEPETETNHETQSSVEMTELGFGLADVMPTWMSPGLTRICSISSEHQSSTIDKESGKKKGYYDWSLVVLLRRSGP